MSLLSRLFHRTSGPSPAEADDEARRKAEDQRRIAKMVADQNARAVADVRVKASKAPEPSAPPQARRRPAETGLRAAILIFDREFSPKERFVDSILERMEARGETYRKWMTDRTPVRIAVHPRARDSDHFLAVAITWFRQMVDGRVDLEEVEYATFDGSGGISGVILTLWHPQDGGVEESQEYADRALAETPDERTVAATWYSAASDARHTRQVVMTLPGESSVAPRVANLMADFAFMQANWAATLLVVGGEGPFVFAKATGIVEKLEGRPATVAFAFYRLRRGGVFQIFVEMDSPALRDRTGGSNYVVEHSRWLDEEADRKLVNALIGRDELEICFVAPGDKGPCTGYFGLRAALTAKVKEALAKEWDELLIYHNGIASRDYEASLDQYNQENPMESSPILPLLQEEPRAADRH